MRCRVWAGAGEHLFGHRFRAARQIGFRRFNAPRFVSNTAKSNAS